MLWMEQNLGHNALQPAVLHRHDGVSRTGTDTRGRCRITEGWLTSASLLRLGLADGSWNTQTCAQRVTQTQTPHSQHAIFHSWLCLCTAAAALEDAAGSGRWPRSVRDTARRCSPVPPIDIRWEFKLMLSLARAVAPTFALFSVAGIRSVAARSTALYCTLFKSWCGLCGLQMHGLLASSYTPH